MEDVEFDFSDIDFIQLCQEDEIQLTSQQSSLEFETRIFFEPLEFLGDRPELILNSDPESEVYFEKNLELGNLEQSNSLSLLR